MFGKKKNSKEEMEQMEQNLEQGNQLLSEFSGKKDWMDSNYDHISKSRQQMEADIDRILEHISSASEVAKRSSELSAKLSFELDSMREQMVKAESDYQKTVTLIAEDAQECQNLVEENKHFTTPSKYLSELPNELRAENAGYRRTIGLMNEQSRQMGVLALNAAIEAGRMGEQGRQFVTAAEEIRSYSRHYDDTANEILNRITASDKRIAEMEEVIHHLIALLKESNMGIAHLMKELFQLKQHVENSTSRQFSEDVKSAREVMTELKNGSEEIIKSEERSRMQMDDISEEVEAQKKSEQELIGELQKLFYATGLYVERLQKEEEE
jgi:predicted nucleic acid-binding protein